MSIIRNPQFSMRNHRGFTLVEVVAVMGILTIGMLGALAAVTQAIRGGTDSARRTIAVNLATEGVELVRGIRDTNKINADDWNQDLGDGTYLLDFNLNTPSAERLCSTLVCPAATPLAYASATGLYAYDGWAGFVGTPSPFTRTVSITQQNDAAAGTDYLLVTSTVSWQGHGTKQVSVSTHLYDWRP
jgi:prepilin-type N-terminal cleavage/methylation domain-containing protein